MITVLRLPHNFFNVVTCLQVLCYRACRQVPVQSTSHHSRLALLHTCQRCNCNQSISTLLSLCNQSNPGRVGCSLSPSLQRQLRQSRCVPGVALRARPSSALDWWFVTTEDCFVATHGVHSRCSRVG